MVLETCRYVHEPDLVQTMDMATLTVLGRKEMVLYAKNAACFSCSLRQVCHFNRATMKLIVNTTYGTVLKLVDHRNNTVCKREEFTFGEHGNYTLRSSTCLIEETSPPVNTDLPIYFAILAILLVTFLLGIFSLVRRNSSSSWFGEGYEALDPLGYVGPGGLSQGGKYWNCTGGAATLIDRFVLGESHIYRNPTCKNVYECSSSFEPEGLLGTLTATINVFIGLQISQILLVFKRSKSKFIRFFAWAAVLFGAGTFLDGTFKPEIGLIPINKNLWSLSFTFVTSAVSIIVFSILFLVIDVCKWWDGSPFTFTGKNAIVLYVAHVLFRETFPVQWKVENEHPSRLALNLWGVAFWIIVGFFMHRRGIYLSL
ncbi:hypothetical protein QR680_001714 [Steinernema hermaphroditum]|uniref:Heparan-alpha-glucosaminide N-acetyltransferase catalytic domain-containing protein n=1 Tax=Steinernema hermaphroditum TaxID=289476 RepID=A0AA39LGJ9_9BILA|nr:hypothetical protein QR680_001714 [Steinernema hermaphroditum]